VNNELVLSWTNAGFNLQSAPALTGPFTNLPAATSPTPIPSPPRNNSSGSRLPNRIQAEDIQRKDAKMQRRKGFGPVDRECWASPIGERKLPRARGSDFAVFM